jgi:hypothetical protein
MLCVVDANLTPTLTGHLFRSGIVNLLMWNGLASGVFCLVEGMVGRHAGGPR